MTELDDLMRSNCRQIPVLKFCTGCNESILPGRREGQTLATAPDGSSWHYGCYRAAQNAAGEELHKRLGSPKAEVSDLY